MVTRVPQREPLFSGPSVLGSRPWQQLLGCLTNSWIHLFDLLFNKAILFTTEETDQNTWLAAKRKTVHKSEHHALWWNSPSSGFLCACPLFWTLNSLHTCVTQPRRAAPTCLTLCFLTRQEEIWAADNIINIFQLLYTTSCHLHFLKIAHC